MGGTVWVIKVLIGCTDDSCKNTRGVVFQVNEVPKWIVVLDRNHDNGLINVFKDIDKDMAV